jgi:hypothetical protein
MPYCNLSETVHNKWLQQSNNCGNDLCATTCDDKIRAVMQMTNYRAYLKGKSSGISPSRQELKLWAARRSSDPKKIVEVLSQLLEWRWQPPKFRIWKAKRSLAAVATQDRVIPYYAPNSSIKHSKSDSKDRSQEIL